MIRWENYYKLPLRYDTSCGYVLDSENTNALQFDYKFSAHEAKKIVSALNGETEYKIEKLTVKDNIDFYINGDYSFCVRGFGHLTGTGACNLSYEKAAKIQYEFVDYILNCLTEKNN